MEKFNSIPVIRHLDDIDDLRQHGRDSVLLPNQESEAREYADELVDIIHTEHKKALMLICSTQKRGIQTGELISNEIEKKDSKIKTLVTKKQLWQICMKGFLICQIIISLEISFQA